MVISLPDTTNKISFAPSSASCFVNSRPRRRDNNLYTTIYYSSTIFRMIVEMKLLLARICANHQTGRRFLHSTASRCRRFTPGRGGQTEERFIAQALRKIRESPSSLVVEVMNACHVDIGSRYLPLKRQRGQVWIRILTHADSLSRPALAYQMQRAARFAKTTDQRQPQYTVIAVNLKEAESLKTKHVKPVMHFLAEAQNQTLLANTIECRSSMLVCGLPNTGKSSLVHCLTKLRTMEVRKKKAYHLPKINATAGYTLGSKTHAFEYDRRMYSLTDTPGLRPRLESLHHEELAYLLATGSTKVVKGMFDNKPELETQIVEILWKGLKRHADLSGKTIPFDSWEDLRTKHSHDFPNLNGSNLVQHLMSHCMNNGYGGIVIERGPLVGAKTQEDSSLLFMNPSSVIMAMNEAAVRLRDGGGLEKY